MEHHQYNKDITVTELLDTIAKNESVVLLDVREPAEFSSFNIGGLNIPLGSLSGNIESLKHNKEDEVIVICQRGIRSETARRLLVESGFKNARNLTGGLLEYRKLRS